MLISIFITLMVILGVALVLCWAVRKLAPEPFQTWGVVFIVVISVLYAGAALLGQAPLVHFRGGLN